MINNVSSSAGLPASAANASQTAASGKTLVETPIGDVMENEQSTPDFYALFSPLTETPAAQPSSAQQDSTAPDIAAAPTPTLESVFGSQPWMSDPGGTGPGGAKWNYNPIYFATGATAEKVASMVGGTVVAQDATTDGGPFQQTVPNEMIQLADGDTVNAGVIANFFNHGYSQSYINSLLANVTNGDKA